MCISVVFLFVVNVSVSLVGNIVSLPSLFGIAPHKPRILQNMNLKDNLTMIISSCNAFNDLWENHIYLLKKNCRVDFRVILLTDFNDQNKVLPGVEIFECGRGVEFSERLKMVLAEVTTPYVFLTLDDYFLTEPISDSEISNRLDYMNLNGVGYYRLFLQPRPKRKERIQNGPTEKLYKLSYDQEYSFNLYPGIFENGSIKKLCIGKPKNPWQFEVSLNKKAEDFKILGIADTSDVFHIQDMVRKGKYLRKSYRFLIKNNLEVGERKRQTVWYELKLNIRTVIGRMCTMKMRRFLKKIMHIFGYTFYSDYKE